MIASVYLFLIKDNNILLLRRCGTGYEDGKYGLPSGHLEENESLREGAVREVMEEIGITISPKDIDLVHVMHRKEKDERMDFFFAPKTFPKEEPHNTEPHKCDDLQWFPLDKLPNNIIGYIKQAIENYQNKIFFEEVGWK